MKRYRFKTLEEFGGERPSGWNSFGEMDKYMGQEIKLPLVSLEKIYGTGQTFSLDGWMFRGTDMIEIKEKQDTPQRIPKEDWKDVFIDEKILGVEMRDGNKYYLAPNSDGFVPINLERHYDGGYADTTNLETGIIQCSVLDGDKKVFEFKSMQEVVNWATT